MLGRDVAIKTLPPDVAKDPERVSRFRREAHLLASLNHPHIAAIYGFEHTNDFSFLVLELVEGEDLAERLSREALSTREALEIARQVADALEAAHEAGIVHRDLRVARSIQSAGRTRTTPSCISWRPARSSKSGAHLPAGTAHLNH